MLVAPFRGFGDPFWFCLTADAAEATLGLGEDTADGGPRDQAEVLDVTAATGVGAGEGAADAEAGVVDLLIASRCSCFSSLSFLSSFLLLLLAYFFSICRFLFPIPVCEDRKLKKEVKTTRFQLTGVVVVVLK